MKKTATRKITISQAAAALKVIGWELGQSLPWTGGDDIDYNVTKADGSHVVMSAREIIKMLNA